MDDQSAPAEQKDSGVQAALAEYLERVDRGEPIDREAFLARHAPIADELRSFIAAEDEVRKLAGADVLRDQAEDSTKSLLGRGQETVAPQSVGKRAAETGVTGLAGQFGRYRIIRALGKGAMGTVYLAQDTHIERQIALKTPHFTEDPTGEQTERFFREARAAGTLRHPHICPIHDFGQIDGKHFISMAYIEGRPLSAFIQPDKLQTERQILIVIRKLALALQEAHDHGIVHRDLKPANIMVDKKGEPIIMDFGLARQARRNEDIRLTQTGNIIGTPAFMSPEQVEGELNKIGPPTDQYSLGVILYELLTGQLPFRGSVIAVMGQILTKDPPPPSQLRPDLDLRIEAVCLKMMAKNPSERFPSLQTVADELATILKSPAAKATSTEKPASSPAPSPASDRMRADAGASQVLKSLKRKAMTESDLASLEELARKCYSRRDFEQVIQIIERIPEERRNAPLQALLEKSRGKADEISFLICDIDEAVRLNDRSTALKKADDLLKIKPGDHRALEVQQEFAGYGKGGAARIGPLRQFTQPWSEGGWIPWSVLAFGLAVVGVMTAVVVIYLGRTAVVIDIKDPGVEVAVKGTTLTVTGPDKQSVKVVPGDQELTITCAGLETTTKSFTIKKGETKAVTVSIVDSKLVARLENEILPLTSGPDNDRQKKELAKDSSDKNNVATTAPKFFGRPFLVRGKWTIENDELVQPTLAMGEEFDPYLVVGEVTLSNYDLTLEAKKTGGRDKLGVFFHWLGPGHGRAFCLAANSGMDFFYVYNRKWGRESGNWKWLSFLSDRWYSLKVEVRGDTFRAYLDDVLQLEQTDARFTHGRICFFTSNAAARFRRIKVSDPQGKVLFEGLPELSPAGNKMTPKVGIGNSSRSLTGGETAAKNAQVQWAERLKTPVISTNSLEMRLALIPPGEFQMGSPESERQRGDNEQQHRIRITKPFYLGVYEITQSEFEHVMGRNPSTFSNSGGQTEAATGFDTSRNPVENVTWYDAVEFCNKLSAKERRRPYYQIAGIERHAEGWIKDAKVSVEGGSGYFLPTEAQWEYACRAGTTTPFNFGRATNGAESNCNGKAPYGTEEQGPALGSTVQVGSYRPNAFGLYDMHGNVWEWCRDVYDEGYYKNSPESDPVGPPEVSDRVARGGSWGDPAGRCRSALRFSREAGFRDGWVGFRVALSAADSTSRASETPAKYNPQPQETPPSAGRQDGFVPLFNGKDLSGWKTYPSQPGNWQVENGVLIGSASLVSYLYTQREDYQDFHLRVEARLNEDGNSGVYFRAHPGIKSRLPSGYEADINNPRDPHLNRTGSLFVPGAGALVGIHESLVPPGQWFTLEVIAEGNHIVIKVSGKTTCDYLDEQRRFTSGHIALQQVHPLTVVEFRKIEIKELSPKSASTAAPSADRRAAESFLSLGGSVTIRVNGQERGIEPGQGLPDEAFQLIRMYIHDRPNLTGAALEPLRGATNLIDVNLSQVPITDASLEPLQGLTKLEILNLPGTRVTDAGLAHLKGLMRLRFLNLDGVPVTDAGLANLEGFEQLDGLWLSNNRSFTDAGLVHLDGLVKLRSLNLGETGVTDGGLQHVRNLRQLNVLGLNGTRLTDAGLAHLEGLTKLEHLWIERTQIRGSGLKHLRKLVRLQKIAMANTGVTDGDLVHLRELEALEALNLAGTRIAGPGLANLTPLTRLRELDLSNSRLTNAGLVHLKSLPQLKKVRLRGTGVTDAGLQNLEGMRHLRELDLTDTKVTAAGVEKIKKTLPACRIIANPPAP